MICSTSHLTDFGVLLGAPAAADADADGMRKEGDGAGRSGWRVVDILSLAFAAGAFVLVGSILLAGHMYLRGRSHRLERRLDSAHKLTAQYAQARNSLVKVQGSTRRSRAESSI